MASRVVLHVGLMKSGTSYLQGRLTGLRHGEGSGGFLFPGEVWRDQVVAVSDALGRSQRAQGDFEGAWSRMVASIDDWDGTAIISMEFLGPASAEQIASVVSSFSCPVEVVVTARDLGRAVPAMWQESLKNGRSWSFGAYVAALQSDPDHGFWRQQDLPGVVDRWAAVAPVTIVTVPPPGAASDLLWQRFCTATGLPVDACAPPPAGNESLGATSSAVLRLVNESLEAAALPWASYSRHVKFGFAKTVLAARRDAEAPIGFKVPRWLRARASSQRASLEGARVVGSLDDLVPLDTRGADPDRVSERDRLDASVAAIAALLSRNAGSSGQDSDG